MLVAAARASNPLRGPPFGGGARAIHFNAFAPRSNAHPRSVPTSTSFQYYYAQASRITQSARRFVTRLLEPSVPAHVHGGPQAHVSLQGLAQSGVHYHPNPILRNLSSTSKFSLAHSPISRVYLPRGPQGLKNVGYRGLAQEVGLGAARNFSTGRTIFHHVVEKNASIGVSRTRGRKSEKTKKERKTMIFKPKPVVVETKEEEVAQYFKQEEPEVVTYLQVALATTPSARMPFAASADRSIDAARLLPLRAVLNAQQQFYAHSEFVSSLFTRMDARDVWNSPKGRVTVETWGDLSGLCTELRVRFEGWSEEDVRALFSDLLADEGIGGWAIQELQPPKQFPAKRGSRHETHRLSDTLSTLPVDSIPTSMLTPPALSNTEHGMEMEDPWSSGPRFVMPQLDFSSSFTDHDSLSSPIFDADEYPHDHESSDSDLDHLSDAGSEAGSEAWSDAGESQMSMPPVLSIDDVAESVSGWINFSSDFLGHICEDACDFLP